MPAVVATAAADGTPNVTYLSRVRMVDADRVALSNQFFSKTARNLAENPRASMLIIDPTTYDEYRLELVSVTVDGLAELLGFEHNLLLLLDESGRTLFTLASHGFPDQGVGSEVTVGEGMIGMAAPSSPTRRFASTRPSSCPTSGTTSRAGSCC